MLEVYIGGNEQFREEIRKRPDLKKAVRITAQSYNPHELLQYAYGGGLFGAPQVVCIDGVCDEGNEESLQALLPHLKKGTALFVLIERTISAGIKKDLKKHADVFNEYKEKKERQGGVFTFVHAFEQKKRAESWVAYRAALLAGDAPEALHGMLFWKIKEMVKRPRARTLSEARALLGDVAALPTEARRRGVELEYALEQFILER